MGNLCQNTQRNYECTKCKNRQVLPKKGNVQQNHCAKCLKQIQNQKHSHPINTSVQKKVENDFKQDIKVEVKNFFKNIPESISQKVIEKEDRAQQQEQLKQLRRQEIQRLQNQLIENSKKQRSSLQNQQQFSQKKYKKKQEEVYNQQNICPICLDKPNNITTQCNHQYCKECLTKVLKIKNYCPLCRRYNPLQKLSANSQNPILKQEQWNINHVRRCIFKSISDNYEQVQIINDNGKIQPSNIQVSKGAKIYCSPNANIVINGKKVNPNDCNHQ